MRIVRAFVVEVDCPTVEIEVEAATPDEAIALGRFILRREAARAALTLRHGRIADLAGTPTIVRVEEDGANAPAAAEEGVTT